MPWAHAWFDLIFYFIFTFPRRRECAAIDLNPNSAARCDSNTEAVRQQRKPHRTVRRRRTGRRGYSLHFLTLVPI